MMSAAAVKTETKKAEKKETKPKAKVASKPSSVEKPVQFVRDTCEKMTKANPKLARKDVMAALAGKVNRYTISTQWQRWNAARKAK